MVAVGGVDCRGFHVRVGRVGVDGDDGGREVLVLPLPLLINLLERLNRRHHPPFPSLLNLPPGLMPPNLLLRLLKLHLQPLLKPLYRLQGILQLLDLPILLLKLHCHHIHLF